MKRTIPGLLTAALFLLASHPALAAFGRCPSAVSCGGAIEVRPKANVTNSLVIYNTTGTAQLTMTAAGAVTWAGSQTFSSGVTFDSTTTWGASSSVDYNGVNMDFDPTGTVDFEMADAKVFQIDVGNNLASAFNVSEGAITYIDVTTTTGSEAMTFGHTTDDPNFFFAGTGEVDIAGTVDIAGSGDIAGTLVCSKGSATALDVSSGGELNNDGTLDQNGNADFAGNVVLSGSSKTISAASLVDMNAGADVGGAGLNCSFAGNALTAPNGSDMEWQGFVSIGNAAPDGVTDGTDDNLFVEGGVEINGTLYADGAIDADAAVDVSDNFVQSGTSKTVSFASIIDANAGAAIDGAATTIMHNSNFTLGLGTGTTTAAVTIGGGSNTVAVNSSAWGISTVGAVTGIGDITAAASLTGGWDFSIAQSADEVVGAALDMVAAQGGDGASTTAGAGGAFSIAGGTGGATFTDQDGAAGGDVSIVGGAGIALNGAGSNDGAGGDVTITGGAAGGTNGSAVGGNVILNGGALGATIGMVKVGSPTLAITPAVNAFGVAGAAEFDSTVNVDGKATFAAEVEHNGVWKYDNIDAHSAAYAPAAATTDGILLVTGAAAGWTYAYPEEDCDAAGDIGRIIIIKCAASGATGCGSRNIAVTPETATIDGQATRTLNADWQSWTILCGAVNELFIL